MDDEDYNEIDDHEDDEYHETSDADEQEDQGAVVEECLQLFSTNDYIMEPGIFATMNKFFKAGGVPDDVVSKLSENYIAMAQSANLVAEWMIQAGVDIKEVQEMVENHLINMILKHFDPKRADSIFTGEGEVPSWLAEMIEYHTWRKLFYQLAQLYPDCLMLNFTIKLISDAGYQSEISSVATACHQLEVFSRVIRSTIASLLENGVTTPALDSFTDMVCHGEHIYLYTQLLLHTLAQEPKGGPHVTRLSQEVEKAGRERGLDVTAVTLALSGAAQYPKAIQALFSMMSKNALNPADITVLFKLYTSADAPPVALIRTPQLLQLFVDSLFKPGVKINPEHKPKYFFLLAYGSTVAEVWKKGTRKNTNKDELKATRTAIEQAHNICEKNQGSSELVGDIASLFNCLKFPVVAMGVLTWIEHIVSESSYFKLNTDHTPVHLALLDEISTNHVLIHDQVLTLLKTLLHRNFEEMDELEQLDLKKTILDRVVHLFSRGCVQPIVKFIKTCYDTGDTDISLIRYFVTEVLEMVSPPYSQEFMEAFLPLVTNEDITNNLRSDDERAAVADFIDHCKRRCLSSD